MAARVKSIAELQRIYFPSKSAYSIVNGLNFTHSPTLIRLKTGKFLCKSIEIVDKSATVLPYLELNIVGTRLNPVSSL